MNANAGLNASLRAAIDQRVRRIRNVEVSDSMFGHGEAYWCNGKEIAHFERGAVIEVRLTKALIRERREELKADARVELRPSGADWLTVAPKSERDITFVVDLVRAAVKAHLSAPGEPMKPAPTGKDLERRRRFH